MCVCVSLSVSVPVSVCVSVSVCKRVGNLDHSSENGTMDCMQACEKCDHIGRRGTAER